MSPPAAVAASAVLQRLRPPCRLVTIIEGKSLVNDPTGLVLYRFGRAVAVWAGTPGGAALAELQARLSIKLETTAARRALPIPLDRERLDAVLHALDHQIDPNKLRLRRRLEMV